MGAACVSQNSPACFWCCPTTAAALNASARRRTQHRSSGPRTRRGRASQASMQGYMFHTPGTIAINQFRKQGANARPGTRGTRDSPGCVLCFSELLHALVRRSSCRLAQYNHCCERLSGIAHSTTWISACTDAFSAVCSTNSDVGYTVNRNHVVRGRQGECQLPEQQHCCPRRRSPKTWLSCSHLVASRTF